MLLALCLPALAGSGPWTVSEGDLAAYLGAEYQRFSKLATSVGSYGGEPLVVDEGIERTGTQLILGYGVRERVDLELRIPLSRVDANRIGELCTGVGLEACKTTAGVGIIDLRGKLLVVDELSGAPLSLALTPELRLGQLTHATRERITNLGEGTTDLGLNLALGRAGGLGAGFWAGYLEAGGRYRFPNVDAAPGSELLSEGELLFGGASWMIGPAYTLLWRPSGVDVEGTDFTDQDRFARLRVANVRAGGKLIVRSDRRVSLSLSGYGTVYAWNNPSDVFIVSAGLSFQSPLGAKDEG